MAARTFPALLPALPLGLAGTGSITVAPAAVHTLALCWRLEFISLGKSGLIISCLDTKQGSQVLGVLTK